MYQSSEGAQLAKNFKLQGEAKEFWGWQSSLWAPTGYGPPSLWTYMSPRTPIILSLTKIVYKWKNNTCPTSHTCPGTNIITLLVRINIKNNHPIEATGEKSTTVPEVLVVDMCHFVDYNTLKIKYLFVFYHALHILKKCLHKSTNWVWSSYIIVYLHHLWNNVNIKVAYILLCQPNF